ncbi:unnamed protein product [Parnassius apollo]|uniref:(apollo) hypothetical protein n=1 Tax=Parnassius apollo TaxID=110799 RepID=A0A8S3X5Y6_PARAO|nr:unnamed protein product [Parnassius apollo]
MISTIFDRVRKERPENIEKVVPISGDLVLPNLGISQEDEKLLRKKVADPILTLSLKHSQKVSLMKNMVMFLQ